MDRKKKKRDKGKKYIVGKKKERMGKMDWE